MTGTVQTHIISKNWQDCVLLPFHPLVSWLYFSMLGNYDNQRGIGPEAGKHSIAILGYRRDWKDTDKRTLCNWAITALGTYMLRHRAAFDDTNTCPCQTYMMAQGQTRKMESVFGSHCVCSLVPMPLHTANEITQWFAIFLSVLSQQP